MVAVIGLVGATACGQADGNTGWAGEMTDSAGVTIVSNPAEGIWRGASPWRLEEEMRVGSLDGEPETQFGQIGARGIDRLSDGRIVVLDAMGQHLKVFDPDGTHRATFGGPGSGPGELGAGNQFVIVGRGDTIYVPDLQNQRVSLYSGEGSSLGSFPMDFTRGIPFLWDVTGTGDVVAQLRPLSLPGQGESTGRDHIVALAVDGSVSDTLFSFASGGSFSFTSDRPEIRFFAPEPAWDVTTSGQLLYGMSDEYRISVYEPAGTLRRIIAKPFASPPVRESDQTIILEFLEEAWGDAGVPPQAIEQLRGVVEFAETYPAFARLQGGPDGTIWVQRIQPLSQLSEEALAAFNFLEDVGSPNWEVFDGEGRFLGTFTMPLRFAPRLFVGDEVLGVSRDELDVQHLVRMRFVMD